MDVYLIPPNFHFDSLDASDQGQSEWPGSILYVCWPWACSLLFVWIPGMKCLCIQLVGERAIFLHTVPQFHYTSTKGAHFRYERYSSYLEGVCILKNPLGIILLVSSWYSWGRIRIRRFAACLP